MGADEDGMKQLNRTLAGFARHPNFAGVIIAGLGCETNQISAILDDHNLNGLDSIRTLGIQESGGTKKTVEAGIAIVEELMQGEMNRQREPIPVSELMVGLECGGSDGYSGISANPALGRAADLLVANGGTAILSETPEIYGAEHLLTDRADSPQVAQKLMDLIAWWEDYTRRNGSKMDNNPTPGNKAGGLTTILEKSLGAVAKGGSTRLMDVYRYAEAVTSRGFVFMDSPGYDPASITGQMASGANLICFTTGRGSVFGSKPAPCIKIATNTSLYERMTDDMDVNAGRIIDGSASVEAVGQDIFELMLDVASGRETKSEALGFGDNEFTPWVFGAQM
jgi:altronate hydrolase